MKKNRGLAGQAAVILIYMLVGARCGRLLGIFAEALPCPFALLLVLMILGLLAALVLQTAIHEAGHLVFGLLTGYRFRSYRLFGLMWIRQGEIIRFRRLSLTGTGGQCLMSPPAWREDYPYILYNLGGVLMNLLSAGVFRLLSLAAPPLPGLFLQFGAIVGLAFALINGLPLRIGPIDNDGRNLLSIRSSLASRRAFWLQMEVNERIASGTRLRDIPEAYFSVSGDDAPDNSIIAAIPVNRASRLMDEHRFAEAAALQDRLLRAEDLAGIYRGLLTCDRIYCELIGPQHAETLPALLTKEQQKFMKSMAGYPSVLRTRIALALLHEPDPAEAERGKAAFKKAALRYPYPTDIESERELIALAEEKAKRK